MSKRFNDTELQKFKDGNDPLYPDTDWYDLAYKTGVQHRHNVNINGGSENVKYMASLGYLNQTGILPNAGREQFNARTNLDMKINKRLSARMNLSFIKNDYSDASSAYYGGSSDQIIRQLNLIAPWIVARYDDGTWGTISDGSPIAWLDSGMKVNRDNYNFSGMAAVDYEIFDGLKLTLQGAYVNNLQAGVDHAGLGVNGQALDGDHTGNKTGDERRALADGLGDVGGKHGNHEVHGDAADDLEHSGKAVVVRRRRIEGRDAPQERDGGQDTTSDDEDQHVADAVHEVLVDDVADGLLLLDLILDIGCSRNRVVTLGGERAVDQLTGGLDGQGLGNTNGNHALAGETLRLDILIGRDDDGLGTSDLALGEFVLDTDLAMGLDLNSQTSLGSCLLQRLLSHEGVRNAGRATGGGDDVKLSHVSLLFKFCARRRSPTRTSLRAFPQLKDTNLPSA